MVAVDQVELRSWRLAGQIRGARFKGVAWTRRVNVLKCMLDSVCWALRVRLLQSFVSVATHKVKCCDRKRLGNLSFRIDGVGGKRVSESSLEPGWRQVWRLMSSEAELVALSWPDRPLHHVLNSAKTRQAALEGVKNALSSKVLYEFVLERRMTLTDSIERCLKKGNSRPVQNE